jgi:hypothetical protein
MWMMRLLWPSRDGREGNPEVVEMECAGVGSEEERLRGERMNDCRSIDRSAIKSPLVRLSTEK